MNFGDELRLLRCYPYWFAKRCIFVHVPKAAGTSINLSLYGRTLGHYRAAEIARRFPGLYGRSFVFAFVRNPWARALSAYRFAVKGSTEHMGVDNPAQYRIPEFESFERFLIEWLGPREPAHLDFIFQPQNQFVCDESGEQIVEFVGKVETIKHDIEIVSRKLGRKLDLVHINQTIAKEEYASAYRNSEMVDVVSRLYARDISVFDYEF